MTDHGAPHPATVWREAVIETPDFALRERESGAGPPVICLGFEDPERSRMLDALVGSFRLITLSPAAVPLAVAADLDAEALARETLACADRLGVSRFCVLARGDDDHAALRLAIARPERVGCVALIAPDLQSRDGPADDAALVERLGEVKAPVLALFGVLDRVAGGRAARLLRERIPRCRIALAVDAGPAVDVERPALAARIIASFLAERGG